jgi:hypothetical protein
MKKKKNLKKLLNLNFVDYTNQSYLIGKYDLPYSRCPNIVDFDYLALYSEKRNYHKTDKTAVCFYEFDINFDKINGIYNAIYYGKDKLLNAYKERFKEVKFAFGPDYSQCGDIPRIENIHRIFKSRIVSNWLLLECNVMVVPNVTYANENYFDVMLDGMEESNVVAFSIKGSIQSPVENELLLKAIKYTVDNLKNLEKIVVYSVLSDDSEVLRIFDYAVYHNIKVIIPNNLLKNRNKILKEIRKNGKNS